MTAARLFLGAVFCMASLVVGPASAAPYDVVVENGSGKSARLVTAARSTADAVMVISFPVGAVDDGIRTGLTRLSQHMLIDGNGQEPAGAFRRDLYAAAADLHITTDVRQSTFRLRAPRASFASLAPRLLSLLFDHKLEKKALARCKRLTLNDELPPGGREDMLAFLAGSVIMSEGGSDAGADFTNDPYGDSEVIRRLGFDDVRQHVLSKLTPANATVVVTGAFDKKRLERALSRYGGGQRREPQRPDVAPYLPLSFERHAPRDVFVQAHVIELDTPEQAASARLLSAILEERLGASLRKKGVSYELDAFVVRKEWLDLLVVEVPVTAGRGVGLDTELRSLSGGMRDGTFLPGEFERNKRFALFDMQRDDEDTARLADALLDSAGRVSWHSEDVRAALDGMSQAMFLGHARRWLDEKRTLRVTLGPAGAAPKKGR